MPLIPIVTKLSIDEFFGGDITIPQSMCTNVVFGQRPSGAVYATQRPSINIFENASETVADGVGRGVYYWHKASARYFVNSDTVYKGNYSAALGVKLTDGIKRVEFFEVGDYLVIIDAENNEGWTINAGSNTTLIKITHSAFPPNQSPPLTLSIGGMELSGAMHVMCTNGEVFSSTTEDPTTWNLLDFIRAEVRNDGGVIFFKNANHGVLIGERSTEFVYDNANPLGSPLNFRSDVVHDIGAVDFPTFFGDSNASYFVGKTESGDIGVYLLQNLQLNKISENDIDSFLTTAIVLDGAKIMGSGFSTGGRGFYVLTIYYDLSEGIDVRTSLVYDSSTGFWNVWNLSHDNVSTFPLVQWTRASNNRAGNGMLINGDIVTVADDFNPQDSVESQIYVLDDYVEPGYITETSASGSNIELEIITGAGTYGTQDYKYQSYAKIKCNPTRNKQDARLSWSDESNNKFNAGRDIDVSNPHNKLTRCGRFISRNFKLQYSGNERIEIEGIEVGLT